MSLEKIAEVDASEIAIDGKRAVVFDKHIVDAVYILILKEEPKEHYEWGDIGRIARYLLEENPSQAYIKQIGNHTMSYSSKMDYSSKEGPIDIQENSPREIYIWVPEGLKINNKKHKKTISDAFPEYEDFEFVKGEIKVPNIFVNLMNLRGGYKIQEAEAIYRFMINPASSLIHK